MRRAPPPALAQEIVGRERELRELGALLAPGRLLTLTGAPGIGKSRLARELAARAVDGATVVELAPVERPAAVTAALAAALELEEVAGQPLGRAVVDHLARTGTPLVVLDNCEHLLAACRELARSLLEGCPGLRLVATSREALAVEGEAVRRVEPLAVPGPGASSPPEIAASPAVELLLARAGAVHPGLALTGYTAPAIAEICRRLEGIPLALELAAAQLESRTPEEVAQRLGDRLALLTKPSESDLARHGTLAAALDWSHDLLTVPERVAFRRLSVFRGSLSADAAAAVCGEGRGRGEPDVPALVGQLAAKSLLVARLEPGAARRYSQLETVRVYAAERLEEAGETAAVRARHAEHFLALAEECERELTGPGQRAALRRLGAERDNLRVAIEWSLTHEHESRGLRLAAALTLFWRVRCHFSEGRRLLDAALAAAEGRSVDPAVRAKALWGQGFMALMLSDLDGALPPLREALAAYRSIDDRGGIARTLLLLGNCSQYRDRAAALPLLTEGAALAREAGDHWCLAHALAVAGFDHSSRDELAAARPLFEECLAVARGAGDEQGRRFGLFGLGSVAYRQGDLGLARELLGEALSVTEELGETYMRARVLQDLGALSAATGDLERAGAQLEEAIALVREVGHGFSVPDLLSALGAVTRRRGDGERARRLYEEAFASGLRTGGRPGSALRGLGELSLEDGDAATARRLFEEALEIARERRHRAGVGLSLQALGSAAEAEGDPRRATVLYRDALRLWTEVGDAGGIAACVERLGVLAEAGGEPARAVRLLVAVASFERERGYARANGTPAEHPALGRAREALSRSELRAAVEEGAALSLEEAAGEALEGAGAGSPRGRAGLTSRELEVARLVAGGLTNAEVAERLVVSPWTVKRHLAHIFAKLGISSRRDVAAELRRHGRPVAVGAGAGPAEDGPSGHGEG